MRSPFARFFRVLIVGVAFAFSGCGMTSGSVPAPNAANTPQTGNTNSGNVTFTQLKSVIFTPHCGSCHNLSAYATVAANAQQIYQAVSNHQMPPSSALPASYVSAIGTWIQEGMPNN